VTGGVLMFRSDYLPSISILFYQIYFLLLYKLNYLHHQTCNHLLLRYCQLSRSRFIGEEEVVQSAEIKEYLGNTDYCAIPDLMESPE
jgi:hypothetical protein